MTEHDDQVALFEWAAYMEAMLPDLHWLFAIPNGGHRHKAVAAKMKAEGVKRGVLDVCLPVPMASYHGLWIEMKHGNNRITPEQDGWIVALREYGYRVEVCYGTREAITAILGYLGEIE